MSASFSFPSQPVFGPEYCECQADVGGVAAGVKVRPGRSWVGRPGRRAASCVAMAACASTKPSVPPLPSRRTSGAQGRRGLSFPACHLLPVLSALAWFLGRRLWVTGQMRAPRRRESLATQATSPGLQRYLEKTALKRNKCRTQTRRQKI